MTNPITNKVQLTGYAGVQAGVKSSPSDVAYVNSGAILGGEAKYKGAFLRAQVEGGTALGAKAEAGYEFDLGRNMGLELSANAQTSKSLVGNNTYRANNNIMTAYDINIDNKNNAQLVKIDVPASSDCQASWKSGETRFGAGAKYTFGSDKVKFGIGAEAGTRKGNQPNLAYSLEANHTIDITVNGETQRKNYNYSNICASVTKSQFYATPKLSFDAQLGKNWSINANGDLFQGSASIRYNF